MDRDRAARRAQQEIVRLCHAGLDSHTLRIEVLRQLRKVVAVDALFCATVDPATLLFTGSIAEEIPDYATLAFLTNEFLQDDVNKFTQLARANQPIHGLYEATRGEPERSPRFCEILAPLGLGDELRAALRVGSQTWGVVCLHRELGGPGFTAAEATFVQQIAPHLAEGLRTARLLGAHAEANVDGPGLVVLADDLTVISTTAVADRWLAELADWPRQVQSPQAISAVAARLQSLERAGGADRELLPRSRVQTRSGQWLALHAARLSSSAGDGHIAVILEPAGAAEVAPLVLRAYGLTDREAQIAQLVLLGFSTAEISDRLFITALTVQQHLKAVFEKTGIHSRRELAAQIFAQQYLPAMSSAVEPDRSQS